MLGGMLWVGCGEGEVIPPKTDEVPAACGDSRFIVGSRPATSASFDIDCTFRDMGHGVGSLSACKTLSTSLTFTDGSVRTYSLAASTLEPYAASTYEPGGGASTQFTIQLPAFEHAFTDGWAPTFFIYVPTSLAHSGTFPVGTPELSGECWQQSTCIGVAVGAIKLGSSSYGLGEIGSGQVTIDAIGLADGAQVKLHADAITLVDRRPDSSQATCSDGMIHHQP
jgi:hypothetical protein